MTVEIRLADISAASQAFGTEFSTRQPIEQVVLAGTRGRADTPSGMTIKIFDATTIADFETVITRSPNVSLHLVLEGQANAQLDGIPLRLSRTGDEPVRVSMSASRRPVRFQRRGKAGERLRKISVMLSWEFLELRGITQDSLLGDEDILQMDWPATPEDVAEAEQLMGLHPGSDPLTPGQIIALERFGLSQVHHALQRMTTEAPQLSPRDQQSLSRMESFALRPGPLAHITEISAQGGMSVSSARRLFRRAHGLPVMVYLRQLRLKQAEKALRRGETVAAAARLAGYETSEAFATAYRNWAGHSPSQTRRAASRG